MERRVGKSDSDSVYVENGTAGNYIDLSLQK